MGNTKVYVEVTVSFSCDGGMTPLSVIWEDGREYRIDRVLDMRPAAAMKAGGQGDRYTVRIRNRQSHLFFEQSAKVGEKGPGRWFVERR